MVLDKMQIIDIIRKLLEGEGSDSEQEKWANDIKESVPFYEKIINYIFWSNEEMTANQIYERAEKEHKTINL